MIEERIPSCAMGEWLASRRISNLLGKQNGCAGHAILELVGGIGKLAKDRIGRVFKYYPPCTVFLLRCEEAIVATAPEGWLTRNEIIKLSRDTLTWRTAKSQLDLFIAESKIMRDGRNRKYRYYPPQVVKAVLGTKYGM